MHTVRHPFLGARMIAWHIFHVCIGIVASFRLMFSDLFTVALNREPEDCCKRLILPHIGYKKFPAPKLSHYILCRVCSQYCCRIYMILTHTLFPLKLAWKFVRVLRSASKLKSAFKVAGSIASDANSSHNPVLNLRGRISVK